jgi:hypothetical protein
MTPAQHLDAERLAAFMDGSLTRAERRAVEAHAADCAQCLQLLAAMARTEPAPAVRRWRLPAIVRWAVPVAAAATAVALWVNVDRAAREATTPAPGRVAVDALAPVPPPPNPSAAPLESQPQQKPGRLAGADADKDVAKDAARPATPQLEARSGNREPSARSDATRDEARQQERALARAEEKAPAATVPALPTAAPSAAPAAAGAAPASPPAPAAANESQRFRAAENMAAARQVGQVLAMLDVVSPDPQVRWRVRGVLIDRSVDGGKTWRSLAPLRDAVFLSGSSPSPTIAWVAGRRGAVARTSDGETWQRLEFPETVDLTAIHAVSEREATVTTADGRAFRTSDGGRTWSLQEF